VCFTRKRREIDIEFILEQPNEREILEDPVVNGKNVKMDLKCKGWEGVFIIGLTQDRDVVNTVMKLRLPYSAGNFLTIWGCITSSLGTLIHGIS
jgi:hypothetical protein